MVTDVLCGFMQEISTHYALVLPLKITEKMLILQTKLSSLLKKIKWFKRLLQGKITNGKVCVCVGGEIVSLIKLTFQISSQWECIS